jgi:hypothetical protein
VIDVDAHEPDIRERFVTRGRPVVVQTVRGLFSATQIARQLGLHPEPGEIATTFAEVEMMLEH